MQTILSYVPLHLPPHETPLHPEGGEGRGAGREGQKGRPAGLAGDGLGYDGQTGRGAGRG